MNTLETLRLSIRPFVIADLRAAHQLLDQDLQWAGPNVSLEERRIKLQREIGLAEWTDTGGLFGYRAIILKSNQELIGICGFLPILHRAHLQQLFWPQLFDESASIRGYSSFHLEIGYALASDQRLQGYAAEAIYALLDYAFGELQVERIFASTNRSNRGSISLMQRVGMRIAHNPERPEEEWPNAPGVLGVIENYLTQPTDYPEVNAMVQRLLSAVRAILREQFVGLYLYGSLASGDFNLETSDIDFLVVSTGELAAEQVSALATLHQRLLASGLPWAKKLEGSYLAQSALRRYDPTAPACPQINEGNFYLAQQESDWIIQRHILREQGVVVAGPPLAPLIDPVQPDQLSAAVRGFLCEWWAPMLENPMRLQSPDYQVYAVLTMCRALHTLEEGRIVSKPVAAGWAQAKFGQPLLSRMIAEALTWRSGEPFDYFEMAVALIQYTVDYGQVN